MVKGSKTTNAGVRALRASGIDGYLLHLDPRPGAYVDKALFDVDVLVVNIPPGRRPDVESHHMEQMHALGELFAGSPVTKVIFISSTSVYPDANRIVTERDDLPPDKPAGKALRGAEKF